MKIKLDYDGGEGAYVLSPLRRNSKLLLCWGFVAQYFRYPRLVLIPPTILVRVEASRFKGASWVWIKIEYGDGIRWRRGRHTLWNPMFPAARRRVRKLYPSGRLLYTVRKLYYRIEAV